MEERLHRFDLLRGIAIILVVGYHALSAGFPNYQIPASETFFVDVSHLSEKQLILNLNPFAFGNTGVTLFLVISGFLIHYHYISKGMAFNAILFFNKRFWRIYPPYLAALIIFGLTAVSTTFEDWLYHIFLIHNLRNAYIFSINPSFWSLALEAQLYFIYPAYLYLYQKLGNSRSFVITAAISSTCLLAGVMFDIDKRTFYTSVFSYWVIWTMGAFLAHKFYYKERVSNISVAGLAALTMLLMSLRLTAIHQYLSPYLFAILFILLIERLLYSEQKSRKVYRIVELTGVCSYSIYLFHQPLFDLLKDTAFKQYDLVFTIRLGILITLSVFIIGGSYLSYRILEVHSIKAGNRFYKKVVQRQPKFINRI